MTKNSKSCVFRTEGILTLFLSSAAGVIREANEENKTQARSLKTFIYSTSNRQKQQHFVLLQVLKEIREVRATKDKTGSLGSSIFAGEEPHVLVALTLFTKVSIGQCADLQDFLYWVN